jgi:hypothetical protein
MVIGFFDLRNEFSHGGQDVSPAAAVFLWDSQAQDAKSGAFLPILSRQFTPFLFRQQSR